MMKKSVGGFIYFFIKGSFLYGVQGETMGVQEEAPPVLLGCIHTIWASVFLIPFS